jgi:group I intron endonuclease
MKTGVYQIKNIINNKLYIGSASGKGFDHRWRSHTDTLNKNIHHNSRLQNSWNKYGKENFIFDIIEECIPEQCLIREQFYIDTLNPEYNIYRIAGSPRGRILSVETKRKISQSLKGKPLSEERKNKISLSLKGKPKSEDHINKVRLSLWGNEGKLKNSKGGRFLGSYKFLNTQTKQEVICGQFELARMLGNKPSNYTSAISKMCRNKRNSIKKWICIEKIEK